MHAGYGANAMIDAFEASLVKFVVSAAEWPEEDEEGEDGEAESAQVSDDDSQKTDVDDEGEALAVD